MTILGDLLSTIFERRYLSSAPDRHDSRSMEELITALVGATGEVSGLSAAKHILRRYQDMDDPAKLDFFHHLARDMNIDPETVRTTLDAYEAAPGRKTYRDFMAAVEPDRQELIRRLNQIPGATETLVRMRADLLRLGRKDQELQALDQDFRHLFASWFNRGFLVLRPVSWESPAHILEKIIAYEAVHEIASWDDLRRRLVPGDRRCFAFFHPAMPDEPLIFVEVALTRDIPGSIQGLLTEEREPLTADEAKTAVFYSISNCQDGLASISFGNSLIKQVAADLAAELPNLKTFVTLSPIPGLASWLESEEINAADADPKQIRTLAAHYLLSAKRGDGLPLDPVARFHLGNGAQVHAVHADADVSPKGQAQSAGAMVNYLYDLNKVAQNHERFATSKEIAASSEIRSLDAAARKQDLRKQVNEQPAV
ncbi:MAG: malonyl-CoA decarboxylase [Roseibium sp.]|uniref:malonyl-CoA decarboxylase n=1 Tax=Roseibium sp. TaxID=1936156 RepID=UPI001B207DBC|nr:malonyl-CoA decarboxylase [Roseibium sp.]MBO6892564.1 malonyl-CoA decarboxylase [Roseibium sp.]MBO6930329.1 malonyl-CoA decarboxylase [Roseibium sp.]